MSSQSILPNFKNIYFFLTETSLRAKWFSKAASSQSVRIQSTFILCACHHPPLPAPFQQRISRVSVAREGEAGKIHTLPCMYCCHFYFCPLVRTTVLTWSSLVAKESGRCNLPVLGPQEEINNIRFVNLQHYFLYVNIIPSLNKLQYDLCFTTQTTGLCSFSSHLIPFTVEKLGLCVLCVHPYPLS